MYAIIETGGKQYKVEKGDVIFIEKLAADENADITFDKVIAVGGDDGLKVGAPYVDGASVSAKMADGENVQIGTPVVKGVSAKAEVLEHGKGKKVVVFTYKPKKNEKRKMGHRQPYTKVEIADIKA